MKKSLNLVLKSLVCFLFVVILSLKVQGVGYSDTEQSNKSISFSIKALSESKFELDNVSIKDVSFNYASLDIQLTAGVEATNAEENIPNGWNYQKIKNGFNIILNSNNEKEKIIEYLSNLKFNQNSNDLSEKVSITLEKEKIPSWTDNEGKRHYYKFIPQVISWEQAYNKSKEMTYKGLKGYLATISSEEEHDLIFNSIAKTPGLLGGTRLLHKNSLTQINDEDRISENFLSAATSQSPFYQDNSSTDYATGEGWYWATGPEAGQVFWTKPTWSNGTGANGNYAAWNSQFNEPNNDVGRETVLQFAFKNSKLWNDIPDKTIGFNSNQGYYVEFSEYNGNKEVDGDETYSSSINGKVVINYIDENGILISENDQKNGLVGYNYTTEQKEISGYTFKEVQGNPTGSYAEGTTTVTYIYTKNSDPKPEVEGSVITKYTDESGKEIASRNSTTGVVGTAYSTDQKEISGYTFKEVQGNPTGSYTKGTTIVTYVYTKNDVPIKPIPSTPETPSKPVKPDTSSTNFSGSTTKNFNSNTSNANTVNSIGNKVLPSTGEKTSICGLILGISAVLASLGLYIFKKKKRIITK